MKTLPEQFTKKKTGEKYGFDFTQVKRDGDIAIFEKVRVGGKEKTYEVVRIQSHNGFMLPGNVMVPASEVYPSSKMWSSNGFSFSQAQCPDPYHAALEKFEALKEREQPVKDDRGIVAIPSKTRGRPKKIIAFEFPESEFKIKELAEKFGVSVPYVHLKVKTMGDKIKMVRTEANANKKGKQAHVFQVIK